MIDKLRAELDLVERHIEILKMVVEQQPIGIVSLSNETGYPKHKIRYSLRVLEENQLIEPTQRGAVTTEQTRELLATWDADAEQIIDRIECLRIGPEIQA